MNQTSPKNIRALAIAPSTRGFGFVVLHGKATLVNWGVKSVKGDKNTESLTKVEKLLAHYQPDVLVLQDTSAKQSRRSARIRILSKQIVTMAATRKLKAKLFAREKVMQQFFGDGKGTKHALAEILAKRFPEDLASHLPPKRRPWMSEDSRMDIFDAVALVLVAHLNKPEKSQSK